MSTAPDVHRHVETSFRDAPVVGVVRTGDRREALAQARSFEDGGLELIEITFTVPGAPDLVRQLLSERSGGGPPWIGMGSATTPERAEEALAAGAEFIVTPNVDPEVARRVKDAGVFLVIGALTPSEIVAAHRAGLSCVLFDKSCVVASISGYPTWMTFFSTAERLEIGGVPFPAACWQCPAGWR